LREDELPKLSDEQRARAQKLHISERAYAVAIKAAELASERASEKLEQVARLIAEAVRKRDPGGQLKSVVWDFYTHSFQFVTRHDSTECLHSIPTEIVDDVVLEKEGAARRLKQAADFELGGWAD